MLALVSTKFANLSILFILQPPALAAVADSGKEAARENDPDEEPAVTLSQRAVPLIQMLEAAIEADSYLMWE